MNEQDAHAVDQSVQTEIDQALTALAELEALPVEDHVAVFEEIHTTLRAALSRPTGG